MNLFEVYKLWDIEPVEGLDTILWDKDGVEYTDLYGGHAVISIGHCHPHYVEMLSSQLQHLGFYSNAVQNSLQQELASRLARVSGYTDYKLFLCNSGAEANENAMKLASFATGRSRILAFGKAFHGRTSGAVAATDNPKLRAPFNESDKITFIPLNDLEAAERELSSGAYAAAIIEGIQGVAGIFVPEDGFLRELRTLCDKYGSKLILDEIQSGYGRSGKFFAHQYSGVRPDIITTAKGMGNGFPIGGVLISPDIKAEYGMLGTTFGGNHLACTAALAVLDVIEEEKLVENAARMGEFFEEAFKGDGAIKEYRGRGLMIGLELKPEYIGLRDRLLFEKHFFTGAAGASVIRLLPSLTISRKTAKSFVKAWKELTNQ
ncbi:MAG: aminotransferase class III-fold pyridoxal phosphate-dependent enzyme [Candidatus Cryptobacteroides sp.]|nr:aminotransferase class III-fold pyridoxal phosphate-dependent enzyme [Rikenellaceae bacterium]MDY5747312.1 aminotransferase class III-fold pyridoxal phosphate-dependent enzyme [Candidatus Cryptobacteroides sp.]